MEYKKIKKLLFWLAVYSFMWSIFTIARAITIHSFYPLYLVWNLALAWLPLLFARNFFYTARQRSDKPILWGWFFLWILFFPNAFYLLTDFVHLYEQNYVPVWYDIAEIFSYTWLGFFTGFLSLVYVKNAVAKRWGGLLTTACLILASVGVYIGRFFRWNSWDLILSPLAFFKSLQAVVGSFPSLLGALGGIAVFFFVFIGTFYIFKSLLES